MQEELSRAKCQNADLIASQKTSAAQHEEQLNKITEGRQQVEKELKSVESQHESAITEANKVMPSNWCTQPISAGACISAQRPLQPSDCCGNAGT